MELDSFFNPSSIVVIGAAREIQKVGHIVARNLLTQRYKGEVYLVNPKADIVLGKKVYKSLDDIKKPVDLAVLAIPAAMSIEYLPLLHQKGIKHAVLYAAGFKETSKEGMKLEDELIKQAKTYGITILGPNCIGFINTEKNINTTFLKNSCPKGTIGFISQSGALGAALLDVITAHNNIGLTYFISLGNKSVIDESDALEFLLQDKKTEVIGLYLEDVKDGLRFSRALAEAARKKPVIILKSGSTTQGAQAALSHTGGLVGDDQVFSAIVKESSAIRADNFNEMLLLLKMYSYGRIPHTDKILVLSNAGGVGVLLADELVRNGLELITISQRTKAALKKSFDEVKHITLHNPIDLLGDASAFDYKMAITSTLKESKIGAVCILLTPQANTQIKETAKVIALAQSHFEKPIYPIFMGEKSIENAHSYFEDQKMVSLTSYDQLPKVLKKVLTRTYITKDFLSTQESSLSKLSVLSAKDRIDKLLDSGSKVVPLWDSLEILHQAGMPIEPLRLVRNEQELIRVSKRLTFPIVAKVASKKFVHKTEVDGVYTNLYTIDQLHHAFKKLRNLSDTKGCYIQKQIEGLEILIGAKRDRTFGTIVVCGLGGIYTELLKEVVRFPYPFSLKSFGKEIASHPVLSKYFGGFRGSAPIDLNILFSAVSTCGYLLEKYPSISEIDINPLFAQGARLTAVDCRIILR